MEYKLYVDLGYLSETTRFMTVPRYIQKIIFRYLDAIHSNEKTLLDMVVEQNKGKFALALQRKVNEVDEISRNDGNYNSSNRLVKLCRNFGMDKYTFDYMLCLAMVFRTNIYTQEDILRKAYGYMLNILEFNLEKLCAKLV